MRTIILNILLVWPLVAFAPPSPGSAQAGTQRQVVALEIYEGPEVSSRIGYGNCQWLHPLDEPNETLAAQPDYRSDKPYYYAARYGDAQDNVHSIVLDESGGTGTGYDTVYADVNNDNRIDPNTERFAFTLGTTSHAEPVRIKLTVTAGGRPFPYSFEFTAFPYQDENNPVKKVHANCRNSSIFVGQAVFEGTQYKVAIADLNSNGLFNDTEQGMFRGDRFFVDFNDDDRFRDSDDAGTESFSYGRYTKIAGKWYTIQARPDGQSIAIAPAQPELGTVKAPTGIGVVELHSAAQSQRLEFSGGSAEAVAGRYKLASVGLSMSDENDQGWTASGNFREEDLTLDVKPGGILPLPEMLPLTVSIEPAGKAPFEEVSLGAKIVSPAGGTFRTPRSTGRPAGGFEVQDAEGNVVAQATFEYG